MPEVEMFVSLVIPDNTAITASNTLKRMGCSKILNLKREIYYKFNFNGDTKVFENKISKVDLLVNHNKHKVEFKKPDEPFPDGRIRILVTDTENNSNSSSSILSSLKNSAGMKNIKKMETGTLWILAIDDKPENVMPYAWDIARKLLYNKHYQKAEILARR